MTRLHRSIAILASLYSTLVPLHSLAQGMDPALAGSWVSSRPDSEAKLRIDSRRRVSASTIVAQNIPGHWSGGTDGPQLTLDLAADGSFSGAISGGVLGGCAFEGSTDPGSALVNNETSFLDFGVATLSGCDVSTNDGDDYFVLLGATPESLGIRFFAGEQDVEDDAPVLKIEGLSRATGGLGSAGNDAGLARFVGGWTNIGQRSRHPPLIVKADGSFVLDDRGPVRCNLKGQIVVPVLGPTAEAEASIRCDGRYIRLPPGSVRHVVMTVVKDSSNFGAGRDRMDVSYRILDRLSSHSVWYREGSSGR